MEIILPQPRKCKICGGMSVPFDTVERLKACMSDRYPLGVSGLGILYRRCEECGFIFTSDFDSYSAEDWAAEIYNEDYIKVDPGYIDYRPALSAGLIRSQFSRQHTIGLDYGAGSGQMAAMLRSSGWRYDAIDPFGASRMEPGHAGRYNLCSAFEVFEHVADPSGALASILSMCSAGRLMIVIGTQLSDKEVDGARRLSWWYASPRNGHISLFSRAAMAHMARQAGLDYACFGQSTHYLSRGWKPGQVACLAYLGKARRLVRLT